MLLLGGVLLVELGWEQSPTAIETYVSSHLLSVLELSSSRSVDTDDVSDLLAHRQISERVCEEDDRYKVDDSFIVEPRG